MVENLVRSALWSGIPFRDIGSLTPDDIAAAVEVEKEKQKDFYKMMAWLLYNNAALMAVGFNNPKNFPTIEETFPNLFEEGSQQDWRIIKMRIEDYSKRHKVIKSDSTL